MYLLGEVQTGDNFSENIDRCNVSFDIQKILVFNLLIFIFRHASFEGCYNTTESLLLEYTKHIGHQIDYLSLNHCYWLSPKCVLNVVKRCKNLLHVNLLDITLTSKKLVKIISGLPRVESLAFTVANIDEFDNELTSSTECRKILENLKNLTIHFKVPLALRTETSISVQFIHKKANFFEHCRKLEKFHVIGHPNLGCGLPMLLLQPSIERVDNLRNIQVLALNYAIDPAARIFYYGTLLSAAKQNLNLKTLLNPSANFESQIRVDFWRTFWKSQKQLENLDISSISLEKIFSHILDFDEPKPNLRFLNLAETYRSKIEGPGQCTLGSIVNICTNLSSLNLRCSQLLYAPNNKVIQ